MNSAPSPTFFPRTLFESYKLIATSTYQFIIRSFLYLTFKNDDPVPQLELLALPLSLKRKRGDHLGLLLITLFYFISFRSMDKIILLKVGPSIFPSVESELKICGIQYPGWAEQKASTMYLCKKMCLSIHSSITQHFEISVCMIYYLSMQANHLSIRLLSFGLS